MVQIILKSMLRGLSLLFKIHLTRLVFLSVLTFGSWSILRATLLSSPSATFIYVDDVNYGLVEVKHLTERKEGFSNIAINRQVLTEPSLYNLAKNAAADRTIFSKIELVESTAFGTVIRKVALHYCQPLSWTLEKTRAEDGGYNETVEFAVQRVENAL